MREKDVVLKDDADPSLLGRNVAPHGRIVEHISVELDPPCDWNETRERPQKSRLAGAIGSEHRDGLSGLDGQVDVEAEPAALDLDDRMQAHGAPSQRSRRPMRIASETASRMRLRTIAPSGRVSSAT